MELDWVKEFNASVIICDLSGKIIYMNGKASDTFKDDGGYALMGKSLYDCHSEQSNKIINEILDQKKSNIYTIEKNGIKKLIYQSPWFVNGEVCGIAELAMEIPFDMPHHVR